MHVFAQIVEQQSGKEKYSSTIGTGKPWGSKSLVLVTENTSFYVSLPRG